jgi:cyclopropane-fatty-acyl-phospholipid synthase
MAFRYDRQVVFQIQLAKRIDTLPLTRDYMSMSANTRATAGLAVHA